MHNLGVFISRDFILIENVIDGEAAVLLSKESLRYIRELFPGHSGTDYLKLCTALRQNLKVDIEVSIAYAYLHDFSFLIQRRRRNLLVMLR
jgi:hypothetical protein